jgi:hypothetical protein
MLQQPPAGTRDASEFGRKIVPRNATTASRETEAADVSSGARLHYATGRLIVPKKFSKQRFLNDTSSNLSVFLSKLIPQSRERVNYDLCAANGTTFPTYRWLPLSLNMDLRREFTWRFAMAGVTNPFIGANFLPHYGFLVDCRNNGLLDSVTSLSVPAQAASLLVPSVKVITGGSAIDSLLSEFPDLTRPTVQSEVRHRIVHHMRTIRTTPGPPVTFRPCRLAPDRLAIAKAEFNAMLWDGTAHRFGSSCSFTASL